MTRKISKASDASHDKEIQWLEVVVSKVRALRFGSVQITVHDGHVTQIESPEKTRFVPRKENPRDDFR